MYGVVRNVEIGRIIKKGTEQEISANNKKANDENDTNLKRTKEI